jgi:hypothetical protein
MLAKEKLDADAILENPLDSVSPEKEHLLITKKRTAMSKGSVA